MRLRRFQKRGDEEGSESLRCLGRDARTTCQLLDLKLRVLVRVGLVFLTGLDLSLLGRELLEVALHFLDQPVDHEGSLLQLRRGRHLARVRVFWVDVRVRQEGLDYLDARASKIYESLSIDVA